MVWSASSSIIPSNWWVANVIEDGQCMDRKARTTGVKVLFGVGSLAAPEKMDLQRRRRGVRGSALADQKQWSG